MNEIFIDNNCKVCSAYGDWINEKNNNLKLNDQKNLSEDEIMLDTLVFKKEEKVYYFSDAVIMSIASLGGIYKSIYILKLFPKRIRDFIYNIFAKNRHFLLFYTLKYQALFPFLIDFFDHLISNYYFFYLSNLHMLSILYSRYL